MKAASSSVRTRVFHIHWRNAPLEISRPFQPSLIDWRTLPGLENRSSGSDARWVKDASPRSIFYGGNAHCSWDLPAWLHAPPSQWVNLSSDRLQQDYDCSCLLRALIKPSEELDRLIDEEQARVFPNGTTDYTALHYRTYTGLKGEGEDAAAPAERPWNETENAHLLGVVKCVREKTGSRTVFLAISDVRVRRAIIRGLIPGVVGPSKEWAVHPAAGVRNPTDRPKPDEHLNTFVELGMLWRGAYGVWSPSGFSHIARWLQGKTYEYNLLVGGEGGGWPRDVYCFTFEEFGGPELV